MDWLWSSTSTTTTTSTTSRADNKYRMLANLPSSPSSSSSCSQSIDGVSLQVCRADQSTALADRIHMHTLVHHTCQAYANPQLLDLITQHTHLINTHLHQLIANKRHINAIVTNSNQSSDASTIRLNHSQQSDLVQLVQELAHKLDGFKHMVNYTQDNLDNLSTYTNQLVSIMQWCLID
jgi:hypothetical protein